jgi:hypothetical protein
LTSNAEVSSPTVSALVNDRFKSMESPWLGPTASAAARQKAVARRRIQIPAASAFREPAFFMLRPWVNESWTKVNRHAARRTIGERCQVIQH